MPKIDLKNCPSVNGTRYPDPYRGPCVNRTKWRLGDAVGLTQFGVNLLHLEPGSWSAQRHWHEREDEFILVMEGEVVLIEEEGETLLQAGDYAGFKAGVPNGHHLCNRSADRAVILEVGTRATERELAHYPDIDMLYDSDIPGFVRKNGQPF